MGRKGMLYCTYLRYRKVREVKGAARDLPRDFQHSAPSPLRRARKSSRRGGGLHQTDYDSRRGAYHND